MHGDKIEVFTMQGVISKYKYPIFPWKFTIIIWMRACKKASGATLNSFLGNVIYETYATDSDMPRVGLSLIQMVGKLMLE